jgi:hypothetical protein
MKKLVLISMLFSSYMGMGQTADSAKIIGKPIRIGNLVVAQNDFPNQMNCFDAIDACKKLGSDWRLPTQEEMKSLYQNMDKIGGFTAKYYWTSTDVEPNSAIFQNIINGNQFDGFKFLTYNVRAIRSF